MYPTELDELDLQILRKLQHDSSISNLELSKHVGVSSPTVHSRIKRLEQLGYVRGYHAQLDPKKLGFDLQCIIHINLQAHNRKDVFSFREAISQMPEVQLCYQITGAFDYILVVILRNQDELTKFLLDKLTPFECVARIQTSIVLVDVKTTLCLPIDGPSTNL